jgi:prolyl oligopeptidase
MLHEGMPGHHLERALAIEHEAAGGRTRPPQTAFIEGWALYAEGLGEDMGLYTDPYVRYGNLIREMISAAGFVIDTGLHSQGWSREQAIAFRQANVGGDLAVFAVNRISVWPGQILSYSIGADVIRDLKREVSAKLGSKFDIREFHEVVLRDGPLPLDLLQQRVRSYYSAK